MVVLGTGMRDYTAPNNHILHTAMVRASYLVFGDSPPALRLPALLAGIAEEFCEEADAMRNRIRELGALFRLNSAVMMPALVGCDQSIGS